MHYARCWRSNLPSSFRAILPYMAVHEEQIDFSKDDDEELNTRCLRLLVQLNRARSIAGRHESPAAVEDERLADWRYRGCLAEIAKRKAKQAGR
jgi:hypothetical protein